MQRCINNLRRLLVTSGFRHRYNSAVNSSNFEGFSIRFLSRAVESHKNTHEIAKKRTFNIHDLLQHIKNGKVFYLKQLSNVFHTIDFEKLANNDALLLLKCCGSLVPDSSCEQRNIICQDIYKSLQKVNNVSTIVLNRYIKTCTENRILIYSKEFLSNCEPDKETYKLLLENVCQFGNIEDAFRILEIMKNNNVPLDNDSIANLILAHTLKGGLELAKTVLNTLRTAQILENNDVKLAILRGLIRRKDLNEFHKALNEYPVSLTEAELLDFIEELGLNGLESWLNGVPHTYKHILITRDVQSKIEKICVHLIHMKQPVAAMNIYEKFVEPHPDVPFGFVLLKEMLHCNTDINVIITLANTLVEKGLNSHILENLTELALKFMYEEQAWLLLKQLRTVRPHYFWPLFVHHGKNSNEKGIILILKRVRTEFRVKFDGETLEEYVLPYCDLQNSKLLIIKLQEAGFNVRELLSPLIVVLLKRNKTKKAAELCKEYGVNISSECFLPLLAKAWRVTKDSASVLTLLARYCESNRVGQDLVGNFLIQVANLCEPKDMGAFSTLAKMIAKQRLRISAQSADVLQETCKKLKSEGLETNIHSLVDLGLNMIEDTLIPHPRMMDLDSLECHLIELQEKNMETRGVLRRLLQAHASKGNVERVRELRQLFIESGYEESAGIRSAIMHSYVLGGHLDEATDLYRELRASYPEFQLDSFKFIDLATLLIDKDRFEEGFGILESEILKCKKIGNTRSIERNSRNLLNSCKTAEQVDKVFSLLSQSGMCTISNVMLGPLVRIHLKSGDINKAVEKYVELSKKHKCTPLQFELLRAVSKGENSDKLEQVLKATEAVHGLAAAQVGLVAVLAENGQGNALKKFLVSITTPIEGLLHNRCNRWVEERKMEPLICLANACSRLPQKVINLEVIYKCIFNIYDLNGDYDGVLTFIENLPEEARSVNFDLELQRMRRKYEIEHNVKIPNKI